MAPRKKLLTILFLVLLVSSVLHAQESDFDLGSQRSEAQDVLSVPGRKLDHQGLIINPTLHNLVRGNGSLNIIQGVNINDKQSKFSQDLPFVKVDKDGILLTIDFGAEASSILGVKDISGAYSLTINKDGISIVGFDETGAFYGIQTLRQILESPISAQRNVPYVEIKDYPDLPYRGVVEGFYGTPWSHQVRISLIDFYGKFKMNSYLYGPKDDPYHSAPNWRLPYPETEAQNIKELVQACNRNRVNFVWAIHPGQDIKWDEEDYKNLVNKFELMYKLGVRSFAIFFDDISGEGTNPVKQVELLNRLNKEFVQTKGDVTNLTVCPTDYSKLWANPTPQGSLAIYGNTLDPSIDVFWTGDAVCSDLTKSTLDWINSRIKRPAFYWWNYPVTDYVRNIIMQGPSYGLNTSLTANDVNGFMSNPMEHGEASKLALYGVADYTWNINDYNPIDNWERGIVELTPEAHDAYRTFAIHSADTETGYRRDESWDTETFLINNYTDKQYDTLLNEFKKVERVPAEMNQNCNNKELVKELNPWLDEFGKLGIRGRKALELIKVYESGDDSKFWDAYTKNLMSVDQRKAYEEHKSGTMKLQPFYENAMRDMSSGFYLKLTGEIPASYKGDGTYPNLRTTLAKLMFDNDSTTYYTSGRSQNTGDWIGADLGEVRDVREISILQGRNSVDDVDYFDNAILEYSENGKEWLPLTQNLEKQYIVKWSGKPVKARYIRLRKLESKKTNWASVRSFDINPVNAKNLGFTINADNTDAAMYAFDKHPGTSYKNTGVFSFEVPKNITTYTMLMKLDSPIKLRQIGKKGEVISQSTIDSSLYKLKVDKGVTKVEIEGVVEIFEIISQ